MILLIDNMDSFTYNLAQCIAQLAGQEKLSIHRADAFDTQQIRALAPSHIVLSPGPYTPREAKLSCQIIQSFQNEIPILGVCLGLECLAHVHSMVVRVADRIMHGVTSEIHHDGRGIFKDLDNPFDATRYHSLLVDRESVPDSFDISAWTAAGEVMALRKRGARVPVEGVQFHPESFLTTQGPRLIANFLKIQAGEQAKHQPVNLPVFGWGHQ